MYKKNKNLDVEATDSRNDDINSVTKGYLYTKVFCPRCGGVNIYRHRIFSRKYLCNDCRNKWQ
ncbi:MAG TPA: hypothetical protein PK733_11420 [Clostridiales bacterium]|nr:hypothetical protein [Clostridiales bacterium]